MEALDLSGYDLVLSSSSAWAHGVIPDPGAVHVCYCHNPFRYAWNARSETLSARGALSRAALGLVFQRWRQWDYIAAQRVDAYVANSHTTQERIARYFGRESTVLHPPVEIGRFAPGRPGAEYVVLSELMSHKRIDVAVRAFTDMGLPLLVIGDGPDARHLKRLAGPTVRFAGPRDRRGGRADARRPRGRSSSPRPRSSGSPPSRPRPRPAGHRAAPRRRRRDVRRGPHRRLLRPVHARGAGRRPCAPSTPWRSTPRRASPMRGASRPRASSTASRRSSSRRSPRRRARRPAAAAPARARPGQRRVKRAAGAGAAAARRRRAVGVHDHPRLPAPRRGADARVGAARRRGRVALPRLLDRTTGPGQPVLLAGLVKLFGPSLMWWRVLRVVLDAVVALEAFVLVRRSAGLGWALAAWARGRGGDGLADGAGAEPGRARARPRRAAAGAERAAGRRDAARGGGRGSASTSGSRRCWPWRSRPAARGRCWPRRAAVAVAALALRPSRSWPAVRWPTRPPASPARPGPAAAAVPVALPRRARPEQAARVLPARDPRGRRRAVGGVGAVAARAARAGCR